MQPVKVPYEVAKAFEHHESMWIGMTRDDMNLMFMSIALNPVHGNEALILKNFAHKNPSKYVSALANGYIYGRNFEKEVAEMIELWLNKSYVGDEKRDIEDFARMVTSYFQQQK
ncbi:hypothetical protein [Virgibacillus phage Mimir87]|nr:hypothetical protein [Virgibacillus phage Mimir87]